MLAEVLGALQPKPSDLAVDGTFGLGGHSLALLRHVDQGRLLGIERDRWVLARGRERLEREAPDALARVTLVHDTFAHLEEILDARDLAGLDAGLLDLGVNSLQIDEGRRGFAREDETLDLRCDPDDPMTADAATLLATWSAEDLADALFTLGGERLARPIARALVRRREEGRPVASARDLASLVAGIYQRRGVRRQRIHPVTRTVQALRMAVNDELGHLARGLRAFLRRLSSGGRFAVISFHSGEARLVKRVFADAVAGRAEGLPPDARFELITRRALKPSEAEIRANPRARSAQLRAIRRLA
jgi:16S rRNA (cytosine1402-N4)-methyltransferase